MRTVIVILIAAAVAGCASGAGPQAATQPGPEAFPCLSNTLPCGKMAVRPVVKKTLQGPLNGDAERGKQVAFAREGGNCLACHAMRGGTQMGNRGPDLTAYGDLQRSDDETFALIYDMRWRNPDTVMPPMGTNEVLSEQELRDVVAFLQRSRGGAK